MLISDFLADFQTTLGHGIPEFYNAYFLRGHTKHRVKSSLFNENLPFDYLKMVTESGVRVFKHVLYETLTCRAHQGLECCYKVNSFLHRP